MTDRRPGQPEPAAPAPVKAARPRRKPGFMPTVLLGLASFAVLFEFLAFQLNSGNDPALGRSALVADPKAAKVARPVIHRRIVRTKVVHLPPSSSPASTAVPVTTSAPATGAAPSTPAPAPTPAPVTSSS